MKSGSCSATTAPGSAALPFVISTGAPKERSGEICGPVVLSWECFSTERIAVEEPAVLLPGTHSVSPPKMKLAARRFRLKFSTVSVAANGG